MIILFSIMLLQQYIYGLEWDCSTSSALSMKLQQSCSKPWIWSLHRLCTTFSHLQALGHAITLTNGHWPHCSHHINQRPTEATLNISRVGMVNCHQNTHNRHPLTGWWQQYMWYILWVMSSAPHLCSQFVIVILHIICYIWPYYNKT